MIRRLHIKNFRSCKDVLLDNLGGITALVGRNGSGKTNVLRAVESLAQWSTSTSLVNEYSRYFQTVPLVMTVDVEYGDAVYRYSFGMGVGDSDTRRPDTKLPLPLREALAVQGSKGQWDSILTREDKTVNVLGRPDAIKIGADTPCLPALMALLPEGDDFLPHVKSLLSVLSAVRYYPIDEASKVSGLDSLGFVSTDKYLEWLSRYQSTGDADNSVLMRLLYAYHEQKPKFDELRSLLGPRGLELLHDIRVEHLDMPYANPEEGPETGPQKFYFVQFRPGQQLGGGRLWFNYGALSLGTRRVIHLLCALILDRHTVMLTEHPEDGIHRGLLRELIGLLRANVDPGQIILSSHSAVVLNEMAAADVRLVSIHKGATKVRVLTPKEAAIAARFIDEEGTLADFLESVEE